MVREKRSLKFEIDGDDESKSGKWMTWSGDKNPENFMDWSVDSKGNFFMDIPLKSKEKKSEKSEVDILDREDEVT